MDSITRYDIIDGDPKEKLLAQLFDIGRVSNRPPFMVEVVDDSSVAHKAALYILGCTAEEGRGLKWIITGNINFAHGHKHFKGFYDTQHRSGWLDIHDS